MTYELDGARVIYYEYKGSRGRHVVRTTIHVTPDSMEKLYAELRSGQLQPVKTEFIGKRLPEPDWETLLESATVV